MSCAMPETLVLACARKALFRPTGLVNISFIGLPNIVLGKGFVKELIQHEATAENLAAEVKRILTDKTYADEMRANLIQVRQ